MVKLDELTVIRAPIERCFDLSRSVEVHLAGSDIYGEAVVALGGVTSGLIGMGQRVTWRAKHLGVWQTLTSEITAMEPPSTARTPGRDGVPQPLYANPAARTKCSSEANSRISGLAEVFAGTLVAP